MRPSSSVAGRFAQAGFVVAAFATWTAPLHAQRATGALDFQGKKAAVEYTETRVAKHSIDELKIGDAWRLGSGPATLITLEAPLLTADGLVAPGSYRLQLVRRGADQFNFVIDGGGRFVGVGDQAELKGKFDQAKSPGKTLEIKLDPAKEQPDAEQRQFDLTVTFGAPRVTATAALAGVVTKKGGGAAIDGFKLPAELLGKRLGGLPTPVATLTLAGGGKDAPKSYNVLLTEKGAELVAQDAPPTDAFTPVGKHDAQWDRKGSVTWSDLPEEVAHFTLDEARFEKGKQLTLVARVGKRKAEIVIPLKAAK